MKTSTRLLQILAIGFACISCVPFPMRHYSSEAKGGKVIYSQCTVFNGHIPDEILLAAHGIHTYTRLGKHKGKRYIEVRLEIPEGKTVKLVGTRAKLFANETDKVSQVEFHEICRWPFFYVINPSDLIQVTKLDVHEPMVGETQELDGTYSLASYWLASFLELPDSDTFQIVLPQFAVNGELITLPSIQFDRKWYVGFAVINC